MQRFPRVLNSWKSVLIPSYFKHLYSIIALLVLGFLVYGRSTNMLTPMLFGDAWGFLNNATNGLLQCPRWDSLRPFLHCNLSFQYHLFGLNMVAYRIVLIVVTVLNAVLLYILLDRLLPKYRVFNVIVAMLFLIYPTDYTSSWTIVGTNLKIRIMLFLASCLLLIHFWRGNGWWAWAGALIFFVISLGTGEMHVGLTVASSVALFLLSKRQSQYRRMAVLTPAFVIVLFSIWRWLGQLDVGYAFGHSTESLVLSPFPLLSRLISGYQISLFSGWLVGLRRFFYHMGFTGDHIFLWTSLMLIVVVTLITLMAMLILKLKPLKGDNLNDAYPATLPPIRQQFIIALSGLLALGVAYLPIVVAMAPSLDFTRSRTNALPSIGAAVFFGAGLAIVVTLLGQKGRSATLLFVLLSSPFIVLGGVTQIAAQHNSEISWIEQKCIWQQLFELAPDLNPGTNVFLFLPKYGDSLGAQPFEDWRWGFRSALSLLYGRDDLKGFLVYPGGWHKSFRYIEEGIVCIQPKGRTIVPYDQALLLRYERKTVKLELITELLPGTTGISRPISDLCAGCILARSEQQTNLRWLVE
jgi:hypothetical protein